MTFVFEKLVLWLACDRWMLFRFCLWLKVIHQQPCISDAFMHFVIVLQSCEEQTQYSWKMIGQSMWNIGRGLCFQASVDILCWPPGVLAVWIWPGLESRTKTMKLVSVCLCGWKGNLLLLLLLPQCWNVQRDRDANSTRMQYPPGGRCTWVAVCLCGF